jgi:hypothetical protein
MTFLDIEKSSCQAGEYVGFGKDGVTFRIHRDTASSVWWATERDAPASQPPRVLSATRLSDLSVKLVDRIQRLVSAPE